MNKIHKKFSNQFRTQWIKVKFYTEKPDLKDTIKLENVRFCEAIQEAILHPVILDQKSIDCPGAQYVFGWKDESQVLTQCRGKSELSEKMLPSMLDQIPRFNDPFEYIGLNTEGNPDLILSKMMPKNVMELIRFYQNKTGKNLEVSLSSMMSICGGIAVKTFLENRITVSFGCMDSREYGQIGKDRLVVGVPKDQFDLVSLVAGK